MSNLSFRVALPQFIYAPKSGTPEFSAIACHMPRKHIHACTYIIQTHNMKYDNVLG